MPSRYDHGSCLNLLILILQIRAAVVEYVYHTYSGTDASVLVSAGRETSWEDWRDKMSQRTYFADQLCLEAAVFMCGGQIHIVSARTVDGHTRVETRLWGEHTPDLAVLQIGCAVDRHFYSLRDADANLQ